MSTNLKSVIAAALTLFVLSGCAQYDNKRGVEVGWHPDAISGLNIGESTRKDVLKLLGPPSQVIALDDETVFYYLYEYSRGEGLVLIVYNQVDIDTSYDRAIFFFDKNDLLTDFATHVQSTDAG